MLIKCVLCGGYSEYISKYKFHVDFDKKYFGKPSLFSCKSCGLTFTSPAPDKTLLEEFYTKIYRSFGRPHYITPFSDNEIQNRHYLAAFCFMKVLLEEQKNLFIDGNKISILEIGAGWGEIGSALKHISQNRLDIYTVEPCLQTRKKLKKNGYKVLDSMDDIENKSINAIISLHVLEHFANPNDFAELYESKIDSNSLIFLEVPNCRFNDGFIKRPYDSPHLTFWNYESLKEFSKRRGYETLSIYTKGDSIDNIFMGMHRSKIKFYEWQPKRLININLSFHLIFRPIIKKIINSIGISLIKFSRRNNSRFYDKDYLIKNPENSTPWCIVAIFRKK
tara:strand:+ start:329 stop:1333 length:1005 start_codon:yes stop_codon:yes gene_type:complete